MGGLLEFLLRVSRNHFLWELIFVNVIDGDLFIVRKYISHNEILLKSSWKNRVPTIINMFPNDVHSTGSSHVKGWFDSIEGLEAS